jgi:hypothetical protein
MGSITAPNRLIKRTAPEAAEIFVRDEVDLALLVPGGSGDLCMRATIGS